MAVQQVQKDYAAQLVVRLLDASDNPVLGVAFNEVTVIYQKQGSAWATKTLIASDWAAGPEGRYLLLFSDSELDLAGRFVYRVTHPSADTFTGDIDVVEDWATVVDMLTALLNGLAGKVGINDSATSKRQQDETVESLNDRIDNSNEQLRILQGQIAAIKRKMNNP